MKTVRALSRLPQIAIVLGLVGLTTTALQAQLTAKAAVTQYDSLIGSYNLITFGNATLRNYGDTEGALAVGGNLKIEGGVIAAHQSASSGSPTLYVGGTVRQVNGTSFANQNQGIVASSGIELKLQNGFSSLNTGALGSATIPASWNNQTPGSFSWTNPTTKLAEFTTISNSLATATANGTVSVVNNQLRFNANVTDGVAIFNLDASLLTGANFNLNPFSSVVFNSGSNTTFVVNVLNANGRTLFNSNGINFTSPNEYDNLLWNVVDDQSSANDTISFGSGEFYGSILASSYTVSNLSNTKINGQLVASVLDYNSSGQANELHFTPFNVIFPPSDADLPPTPEPATYGLMGALLCLGLGIYKRNRKTTKSAAL